MTPREERFVLDHIEHEIKQMLDIDHETVLGLCCNTCGELLFATDEGKANFLDALGAEPVDE
jgi:hypothetical protein